MINHNYKFAYVKISKSASSTIQRTLVDICGKVNVEKRGHHHINDLLSKKIVNYFKFTFVRNPYSRLVSRYFYAKDKKRHKKQFANLTFKDFIIGGHASTPMDTRWVSDAKKPHLKSLLNQAGFFDSQLDWISGKDGSVLTNFVGKIENLQQDFNTVCDKIGIPRYKLPCVNKTKHKHYTEYYDDETRDIVGEIYQQDIETFGYEFENEA